MCIGEKAVYNWILRILPDHRDHTVRLSSYVPELFVLILHCESFLQRFMYWYHIFKDYLRSTISQNEVALDSVNIYFDFMDSLIGFCLIHVSISNLYLNCPLQKFPYSSPLLKEAFNNLNRFIQDYSKVPKSSTIKNISRSIWEHRCKPSDFSSRHAESALDETACCDLARIDWFSPELLLQAQSVEGEDKRERI